MNKRVCTLVVAGVVASFAVVTGCEKKPDPQKAVGDAVKKAGEGVEKAGEKVQEAGKQIGK